MKILYVATVRSHVGQFHVDYLKKLKELGAEIHAAYRDNSEDKPGLDLSVIDRAFEIPFQRSPFKIDNIRSYFKLKKIIDSENYDLIHCHTPVGGIITRLAARHARKKGTKVVYTAHGFHFYEGAGKKLSLIHIWRKCCIILLDFHICHSQRLFMLRYTKMFFMGNWN